MTITQLLTQWLDLEFKKLNAGYSTYWAGDVLYIHYDRLPEWYPWHKASSIVIARVYSGVDNMVIAYELQQHKPHLQFHPCDPESCDKLLQLILQIQVPR